MITHQIKLTVNGVERRADVMPRLLLADLLREVFGLTGTHLGCEHGACGACTVIVDGDPVRSCLMFAVQSDGCRVETIEGLAASDPGIETRGPDSRPPAVSSAGTRLHPLQEAFRARHALQCGFCTPGVLMTLAVYLRMNPSPSEGKLREALSGNLCRCTGYQNIVLAALDAAAAIGETPPARGASL